MVGVEPMNVRFAAVVGFAILTMAGCTAEGAAPRVASADTPVADSPTGTVAPGPPKESDFDKALRYTRCMTDNGAPTPDPVEGTPLPIGRPPDPKSGTWVVVDTTAFDKCKQFLPATWPVKWDPELIASFRPFGECMRKQGVDYPEPDANGMVRDRTDPTAPRSAEYQAAEDTCRYLIP